MHLFLKQEKEEQHQLAVTAYLKNSRKEHQRILARRQTIEERKERLESLNIQREKEELEQREAELQKVRKAEEERLRQEAKEREKERILQEHEQIKKKTVRERLEQIKKTELGAKAFKDIDIEVCSLLCLKSLVLFVSSVLLETYSFIIVGLFFVILCRLLQLTSRSEHLVLSHCIFTG
jgi:hypothetical protein